MATVYHLDWYSFIRFLGLARRRTRFRTHKIPNTRATKGKDLKKNQVISILQTSDWLVKHNDCYSWSALRPCRRAHPTSNMKALEIRMWKLFQEMPRSLDSRSTLTGRLLDVQWILSRSQKTLVQSLCTQQLNQHTGIVKECIQISLNCFRFLEIPWDSSKWSGRLL